MCTPAYAFDYTTRTEMGLDESLSDQSNTTYAYPKKIYLVQVSSSDQEMTSSPENWIDAIYYYCITRLNFADIPYNYFIDESGNIYQGRKGYDGVVAEISDDSGVVVIGYLSNRSTLTNRAENSFLNIYNDFSEKYGINKDNVYAAKLVMHKSDDSLSYVTAEIQANSMSLVISNILENTATSTSENLSYKAEIQNLTYNETVGIGEKLHVKFTVTNENDFVWFNSPDSIYVSTSDGKETAFAVNGVWDSFSRPVHLSKDFVLPGESVDVEFDLKANALPGAQEISFALLKYDGELFEGSGFTVKFTIEKGDKELGEVSSPDGFLNVRECAGYGCKVITTVDNGQVFVVTDNENEWAKIEYEEGQEGWVYVRYLDIL